MFYKYRECKSRPVDFWDFKGLKQGFNDVIKAFSFFVPSGHSTGFPSYLTSWMLKQSVAVVAETNINGPHAKQAKLSPWLSYGCFATFFQKYGLIKKCCLHNDGQQRKDIRQTYKKHKLVLLLQKEHQPKLDLMQKGWQLSSKGS